MLRVVRRRVCRKVDMTEPSLVKMQEIESLPSIIPEDETFPRWRIPEAFRLKSL